MLIGSVVTKVILVTLVIRGLDEKTKRSLRAEAIRRGLRLANFFISRKSGGPEIGRAGSE